MNNRLYITDPAEEFKYLALIYVQSQNLKGRTPEEVFDLYNAALERIYAQYNSRSN